LKLGRIEIGRHDLAALASEGFGGSAADAGSGCRDQSGLTLEACH
jgi:hypothetical protein